MKMSRRAFLGTIASSALIGCSYNSLFPIINPRSSSTKIAFFTDVHLQSNGQKNSLIEETCGKAVRALKREGVDLIVGGGDLIHRGPFMPYTNARDEFRKFNMIWQELNGTKVVVPGNHDFTRATLADTPNLELFYQEVPRALATNSELDLGGTVLFSFNTILFKPRKEYEYSGMITSETLDWLRERFASYPTDTVKIIVTHMPLLTSLAYRSDAGDRDTWTVVNARELFQIIEGHSTILLQGHLHINEFIRWNNSYSIIGGAVCGKWWEGSFHGTQRGFGVLTIERNRAEWEYIDL
jgi:Icc protein